jgi:alanine racemase
MDQSPQGATTWVEISVDALRANFETVSRRAGVPVCAVVKANAYGHGLVPAARVFAEAGARMLAVTRWEEARDLRAAGVRTPVLLLTPIPAEAAAEAIALDVTLTSASPDDIPALEAAARTAGRTAGVHLKIDTGMGRLGVRAPDAVDVARRIHETEGLALEGVWTHFAAAGTPSGARQLARFESVRSALGKYSARAIVHAANSAATISLPDARYDMVRVGTLLYGLDPPNVDVPFALRDPFTWYARVVSVRALATGEPVGYGSEWRARRPTRVATIAVGYADGFGLEPSARSETLLEAGKAAARAALVATGRRPSPRAVTIAGRRAPVVGRISMQQATVSIEGIDGVRPGDVAIVPARHMLVSPAIGRVYR